MEAGFKESAGGMAHIDSETYATFKDRRRQREKTNNHRPVEETMACLICSIINGCVPSQVVYEDADSVAFLDARPVAIGHIMLVPRTHVARIEDLTPAQAEALFSALHRILTPIKEVVGADATTIGINNGPGSGQEIQHVHIHIIPRRKGDGGGVIQSLGPGGRGDSAEIAKKIRKRISAGAN
jgi:histidine triad (HIT) family protein